MTTYVSPLIGARLNATETEASHKLGTQASAQDGTIFQYVQANGAISASDLVTITQAGQCEKATIANAMLGQQLGVAQIAFADNEYGWVAVKGNPLSVNVSATSTLNVALYVGTTSGHVSTTAGSATLAGVAFLTANTSTAVAAFSCTCSWPRLRIDGQS
jgi:hypothetical protein